MATTPTSTSRLLAVLFLVVLVLATLPGNPVAQPRFDPFRIDELGVDARQLAISAPGRFGYLFPSLANDPQCVLPFDPDNQLNPKIQDMLRALAAEMKDDLDPSRDTDIPAGITYLGQFINHDITFDPVHVDSSERGPIRRSRWPLMNLDSVYGMDGASNRSMYDSSGRLLLGNRQNDIRRAGPLGGPSRPLIPNPRNDENLIVAQLHVAFARFHNAVVGRLLSEERQQPTGTANETVFERARQLVRWHYQWIVLHEVLPSLIDPETLNDVTAHGPRVYVPIGAPFIPVEFALAAFRFGHSMVRQSYDISRYHRQDGSLERLFHFTYRGEPPTPDWFVDWGRFFRLPTTQRWNHARRIDTRIVAGLHSVPGVGSLAETTLLRGYAFGLPSGQCVAKQLREIQLTSAELEMSTPSITARCDAECPAQLLGSRVVLDRAPLWWYLLREAEIRADGNRLGPLAGRIVAEVVVGLLRADPTSILHVPDWRPTWGKTSGHFSMGDLLRIAGLDEPPA